MTSWVLNGRDPSEVKALISSKLALEEASVKHLDNTMDTSENLTKGMVNILNSFEARLKKLEDTILPVYQVSLQLNFLIYSF